MATIKYGIDLGTTNSSIATIADSEPSVFKTDAKEEVMPSCVSFSRNKTQRVGLQALNDYEAEKKSAVLSWKKKKSNAFIEFKRGMGSNAEYVSTYMKRSFSAIELSSLVLQKLKTFVPEDFSDVVITVPAKFTVNQKAATVEAAKMAGFRHCELLQEPLAASFAYGLTTELKDGVWMVYDFGGGTFDAALVHSEDGVLQIFDTEGDSFLGGKDLDYAIVDQILFPYLILNFDMSNLDLSKRAILRESLKIYAEKIRRELTDHEKYELITDLGEIGTDADGEDIYFDNIFTRKQVFEVIAPLYQKSVDMCLGLLERNKIKKEQLTKIILVGGPTYCPLIREKLKTQICPNIDCSVNPMTAVAVGAALYAQNIVVEDDISADKIKNAVILDITSPNMSVNESEWISFKTDKAPAGMQLEFSRADGAWSSGRIVLEDNAGVAELFMELNRTNSYSVSGYDDAGNKINVYPETITIINGTKVSNAVLPYNICYSYLNKYENAYTLNLNMSSLVAPFSGLEKNNPLPAVGKNDSRICPFSINPDSPRFITIPIYQADYTIREESNALCYEHVTDIVITGKEIGTAVREGDPIYLTLKVDTSEMMEFEAFFPIQDVTVKKKIEIETRLDNDQIKETINNVYWRAKSLVDQMRDAGVSVTSLDRQTDRIGLNFSALQNGYYNAEPSAVLQEARRALINIDNMFFKNERKILKQFINNMKNRKVDPNNEKQWKALLSALPPDETIETMDINDLKTLCKSGNSIANDLSAGLSNAKTLRNWYISGEYTQFNDPVEAERLLDKLNEIGFDNLSHPEYYATLGSLIKLIPTNYFTNSEGYLE